MPSCDVEQRRCELRRHVLHRHQPFGESGYTLCRHSFFQQNRRLAAGLARDTVARKQPQVFGHTQTPAVHSQRKRGMDIVRLERRRVVRRVLGAQFLDPPLRMGIARNLAVLDAGVQGRPLAEKIAQHCVGKPLRGSQSERFARAHCMIHDSVRGGTRAFELVDRDQQQGAKPRILERLLQQGIEQRIDPAEKTQGAVGNILYRRAAARVELRMPLPGRCKLGIKAAPGEHACDDGSRQPLHLNHELN